MGGVKVFMYVSVLAILKSTPDLSLNVCCTFTVTSVSGLLLPQFHACYGGLAVQYPLTNNIVFHSTGASGYIGGTILHALVNRLPDFEYTALVRNRAAADKIQRAYPNVAIALGDLDSLETLQKEAASADIVINAANNDHIASIPAILSGLSTPFPQDDPLKRESDKNRYLIHTSGTSILLDKAFGRGTSTGHLYNDSATTHRELIFGIPDDAWHRDADKLVLLPDQCPRARNVHVAIVCPPCIYGRGTGTGKVVSWQLPQLVKHFIKRGKGFTVHEGEAVWGNVHVVDLAEIYLLLFHLAVSGSDDSSLWDTTGGYYLSASGEHHWGHTMKTVAQILYDQGKISSAEVDPLSPEDLHALGSVTGGLEWGCNSRGKAVHARNDLHWKPTHGELVTPAPASETWTQGIPLGLGMEELLEEVAMVEEGLCD